MRFNIKRTKYKEYNYNIKKEVEIQSKIFNMTIKFEIIL